MKAGLDLDEWDHSAVVNALFTKAKPFLQAPGTVASDRDSAGARSCAAAGNGRPAAGPA